MSQVRSRRNGLILNIPADARGVVSRFATQGGNELIFDQPRNTRAAPEDKPLRVESMAPDSDSNSSGSGREPDIA